MRVILASKSGVRKIILDKYKIENDVIVSNVDEDEIKESLLSAGASPLEVSKNLAEVKSIRVSNKNPDRLVIGADSVISLDNELINKPKSVLLKRKILAYKLWKFNKKMDKNLLNLAVLIHRHSLIFFLRYLAYQTYES